MKTVIVNPDSIERKWFVVDAKDIILGRLASNVARLLQGKHKACYSHEHDSGDYVVIINASEVKLTGTKAVTKEYFSHSTYSGGGHIRSFAQMQAKDPAIPVTFAVKGMLPKNTLGRAMLKKLHVYGGTEHPHLAQKPEVFKV